jgi:2-dehydro-3-deoxygluconokinase
MPTPHSTPRTPHPSFDLLSIGECLVELSRHDDQAYHAGFAGDAFNTLFYAARLGLKTGFVSAVGDDLFTPMIVDGITAEGIDTTGMPMIEGRRNGLYFIETDAAGERSFHYWRSGSAATQRLLIEDTDRLLEYIRGAERLLITGVSLAVLEGEEELDRLIHAVAGTTRIFLDSNYRPKLWPSVDAYRSRLERLLPIVDTFLPSHDDLDALWPGKSVEEIFRDCRNAGVRATIVKMGAAGCMIEEQGTLRRIPAPPVASIVDTTGAGDAFNGGYIAGEARGWTSEDACALGHGTAARALQVRGAIDRDFREEGRIGHG